MVADEGYGLGIANATFQKLKQAQVVGAGHLSMCGELGTTTGSRSTAQTSRAAPPAPTRATQDRTSPVRRHVPVKRKLNGGREIR